MSLPSHSCACESACGRTGRESKQYTHTIKIYTGIYTQDTHAHNISIVINAMEMNTKKTVNNKVAQKTKVLFNIIALGP